MEAVFLAVNFSALVLWVPMIALPTWRGTRRLLASPWVVAPWLVLYLVLTAPHLPTLFATVLQPTLANIAFLLGHPEAALVAWVHFVAFDLFVGRWIYLDSRQHGRNPWLMAPVLFLTLMVGPFGLLVYLIIRRENASSGPASTN
jgi:hypothetical protein